MLCGGLTAQKQADGPTEEELTVVNKLMLNLPLYNAKNDKGTAFYMKDGEFTLAERDFKENDLEYTEEVNFCIRAYTVK